MTTQLTEMMIAVRTSIPGVRIGLMMTIPPCATQDGFGANYGVSQTRNRYKINRDRWVEAMIVNYDNRQEDGIHLIPVHAGVDTYHGFPSTQSPISGRDKTPATRHSNGVHPNEKGLYQIADTIYAFFQNRR